jgi:hypothetical protein
MSNPITSTKPKRRKFNLLPPCNNKTHNNKEKLETRSLNIKHNQKSQNPHINIKKKTTKPPKKPQHL